MRDDVYVNFNLNDAHLDWNWRLFVMMSRCPLLSACFIMMSWCHLLTECYVMMPWCYSSTECYVTMSWCHSSTECYVTMSWYHSLTECYVTMSCCHSSTECYVTMSWCHSLTECYVTKSSIHAVFAVIQILTWYDRIGAVGPEQRWRTLARDRVDSIGAHIPWNLAWKGSAFVDVRLAPDSGPSGKAGTSVEVGSIRGRDTRTRVQTRIGGTRLEPWPSDITSNIEQFRNSGYKDIGEKLSILHITLLMIASHVNKCEPHWVLLMIIC